jgi:hypothetical protein
MKRIRKIIKTCANCKHFKIVKHGYEIKNILDTAFLISSCKVKGWEVKEYYLTGVKKPYELNNSFDECEFWEEWKPKRIFRIFFWRKKD